MLELCYRTREEQPNCAVFWVPAVSQESFEQAYREIGTLLRIPGIEDSKADIKRLVKAKLSDEGFGQWLMIVDNADDVGILFDPVEKDDKTDRLIDIIPHSSKGSIIFTTRTRTAAIDLARSTVLELGELGEAEARHILSTHLLPSHQNELKNKQIVGDFLDTLAYFALAIIQAIAFINKNNTTLTEYISTYRDNEKSALSLLSADFEDNGRYRDSKNPVATTWYISFEMLRVRNPLAADHMCFMACTTGENIPESLLSSRSSKVAGLGAIGLLNAYSFVTERQRSQNGDDAQSSESMFYMHRLVRLAMRNWLKERGMWQSWINMATARLADVIPYGGFETRVVWTAYLPHAVHILNFPEVYDAESMMSLLSRVGKCEYELGRYKAAETTYQRLLQEERNVKGKTHPDTLTTMHNLGTALCEQGRLMEAATLLQITLVLKKAVMGKEHPDTLETMSWLGVALKDQGKYAKAEAIHRKTLAIQTEVLGNEHEDTMSSMNDLGSILYEEEKYRETETTNPTEMSSRRTTTSAARQSNNQLAKLTGTGGDFVAYPKWSGLPNARDILDLNVQSTMKDVSSQDDLYSNPGSLRPHEKLYENVLINQLSQDLSSTDASKLKILLPSILGEFAVRLGHIGDTKAHLDMMYVVYKHQK